MTLDIRDELKTLLSQITYTDAEGQTRNVNVYFETDVTGNNRVRFTTPALIIRGLIERARPVTIGWTYYEEEGEIDVSLYLKMRTDNYDAYSVRKEITSRLEELIKSHKDGIGSADYLLLTDVRDRDFLEEKGTLRRDFTISVYRKGG
ncbi:MAG: hypothetical protein H0Z19_10005 [Archaeoglobus sp.]|uniref:hypothetical protein n=1 Tax=Archaeoglobus sp. TaxID=1872626 RepID=UPI001DD15E4C|nr:hypothetical protein [Archaeoglobus sp.]MBO8180789.1 hypothetical protein [Archaeoglobus sp.]